MINRLSVRIHSYVQRLLTRLYRNKIGIETVYASLSRQNSYTYGLSIVAIAKNEGSYILEWVSYHKAIGVDHIYIYDNGSTDSTVNVIRKFIDDGYVTLIEYPGDKMQLKAYNNAIDTFANNSAYIAFIDCDEFLVADGDIKSKVECIFNTNHKVGSVTLNWAMFGSDGYESRPEGLVI